MIQHIFSILKNTFFLSPWFMIPVIMVFFISIISLIFICLIITLDLVYRPNIKQYPFNIILDHITPIITIFSPIFIIITLNPENTSLLTKFVYGLFLYIFFLLPLIYFWSKHRNWFVEPNNHSWKQPSIYLRITVALIYPLVFGFLLCCLRLLRLGTTINVFNYINSDTIIIMIFLILILPYAKAWAVIIKTQIMQIYTFLWQEFLILLKSIIFRGLQYKILFKMLEFIHKISFIWISFIIYHPFIYRGPQSKFRFGLHFIYLYPISLYSVLFGICFFEMLLTKGQLYFSLQLFIIFIILKPIFYLLNTFNTYDSNWVEFCCYSNYLYREWDNVDYPLNFWLYFKDMYNDFNETPKIEKESALQLNNIIVTWTNKEKKIRLRDSYIWHRLLKKNISLKHRIQLSYRRWSKI
jgi:hypothetical protein